MKFIFSARQGPSHVEYKWNTIKIPHEHPGRDQHAQVVALADVPGRGYALSMKTVSLAVDEDILGGGPAKGRPSRPRRSSSLVQDYLGRLASGTMALPSAGEAASRKRLLELLKECNLALDGRPTRESFYTDHRFH